MVERRGGKFKERSLMETIVLWSAGGGRLRVHVIVPCTCDPNLRAQMIVGAPQGVVYVYM